jgi:hypothetical protein
LNGKTVQRFNTAAPERVLSVPTKLQRSPLQ